MINVPYFKQETLYTCVVASARMILHKLGHKVPERKLAQATKASVSKGTSFANVKKYVEKQGFRCSIEQIRNKAKAFAKLHFYLRKDVPIIVTVDRMIYDKKTPHIKTKVAWEGKTFSYHCIVVRGIDDKYVYFNDPHEHVGRIFIPVDEFAKAWFNKRYPGYLVTIK
ncbi:MAG TPA: C39 family peptidase [Candidatus Nanoarchaeia archaeon]|nr:C39 family peptidase [Candidatus Nanoarchaeia archaeon]